MEAAKEMFLRLLSKVVEVNRNSFVSQIDCTFLLWYSNPLNYCGGRMVFCCAWRHHKEPRALSCNVHNY